MGLNAVMTITKSLSVNNSITCLSLTVQFLPYVKWQLFTVWNGLGEQDLSWGSWIACICIGSQPNITNVNSQGKTKRSFFSSTNSKALQQKNKIGLGLLSIAAALAKNTTLQSLSMNVCCYLSQHGLGNWLHSRKTKFITIAWADLPRWLTTQHLQSFLSRFVYQNLFWDWAMLTFFFFKRIIT